jgi:hypothetical protein
VTVRDPDLVIHDHRLERLLPPKAAMRLSVSSPGRADDCNWVEIGMAASCSLLHQDEQMLHDDMANSLR